MCRPVRTFVSSVTNTLIRQQMNRTKPSKYATQTKTFLKRLVDGKKCSKQSRMTKSWHLSVTKSMFFTNIASKLTVKMNGKKTLRNCHVARTVRFQLNQRNLQKNVEKPIITVTNPEVGSLDQQYLLPH